MGQKIKSKQLRICFWVVSSGLCLGFFVWLVVVGFFARGWQKSEYFELAKARQHHCGLTSSRPQGFRLCQQD